MAGAAQSGAGESQTTAAARNTLPQPTTGAILGQAFRRTAPGRLYHRWQHMREADVFLLSYPKSGRTWLRLMLGQALLTHYEVTDQRPTAVEKITKTCEGVPRVVMSHDDNPELKRPGELVTDKGEYRDSRVVLLVRDPRDLIVSLYFGRTRRRKLDAGSLGKFVYCDRGGVDTIIHYFNVWAANRDVPRAFHLMRYEDLHLDAALKMRKLFDFLGLQALPDDVIAQAVDYASFDNMRRMEKTDELGSARLRPGDPNDPESYKTRRGKAGGFVDYLAPDEVQALNEKVDSELLPLFGYSTAEMTAVWEQLAGSGGEPQI